MGHRLCLAIIDYLSSLIYQSPDLKEGRWKVSWGSWPSWASFLTGRLLRGDRARDQVEAGGPEEGRMMECLLSPRPRFLVRSEPRTERVFERSKGLALGAAYAAA